MNMKKSIIISLLFCCVSILTMGQTRYATMRVMELNKANSQITIVYENQETETIEINGIGASGLNEDKLLENQLTITRTINKIAAKGYKLVSESTSSFGQSNYKYTNYTFIKE